MGGLTMDVRTLLGRISYNRALARELSEQIEAIYAGLLPHGLRYDRDNVQSSGSDRTAEALDKAEDKRRQRQALIDQADRDEETALQIIAGVQQIDAREAEVLTKYYLRSGRDTFAEIAEEMHYSERQIMRIHRSAVEHAQAVYDELSENMS